MNFWVSPNGDNANPGTSREYPWRTVAHALANVGPGDSATFMDGPYGIGRGLDMRALAGVEFHAENPGEAAWLLESNGWAVEATGLRGVTLRGLVIRGDTSLPAGRLVTLQDCKDILLKNCDIGVTAGHVVMLAGDCEDITLDGCELHQHQHSVNKNGLHIEGPNNKNITLRKCDIHHIAHNGIDVNTGSDITVEYSWIWDTNSHGISVGASLSDSDTIENVILRHNTITGAGMWESEGRFHAGIRIHRNASGILVLRNVVTGSEVSGLNVWSTATGPVKIHHNVFDGNNETQNEDSAEVYFSWREGEPGDVEFYNNVIVNRGAQWMLNCSSDYEQHLRLDHNLYDAIQQEGQRIRRDGTSYQMLAGYQAAGFEPGSVIDQLPLLDDEYRPLPLSPCVNAGVDLGYPFSGSAPDIGAYEYEQVEPPDPEPPDPEPPDGPTNWRVTIEVRSEDSPSVVIEEVV